MKPASIKQIKDELQERNPSELLELCLRLGKFKKENKELLTYLLFEASDEAEYVRAIKEEMDDAFDNVNRKTYYLIKKGIRKILTTTKKQIRYSNSKETEVDLLIHFLMGMCQFAPSYKRSKILKNTYARQTEFVKKRIAALHEDLQYDYNLMMDELKKYH